MNGNYGNMNNGGVPPVQGNPGMAQQPMQQPMMQQPMQQPVMNQQGFGQPIYQPPKKKLGAGKIILIVVLALVVLAVVYNVVLVKSLKCESTQDMAGGKLTMSVVYKKRLSKPYSLKTSISVDLSKYDEDEGGMSKEDVYKLLEFDDKDKDPCEDYKSGCSYTTSTVGDKKTISVTLKGKALEEYMDDKDIKESEFVDFDDIKEDFEKDDDSTCK
ncbi:MAG: hypothetical protein IKQ29_01205 [Bacilli bacterium]|nr:hypothetical protein [Bacilli bacterium]